MDIDPQLQREVHQARGRFAAMAATYGLGVFNDSFYRQAAIFLALGLMARDMEGWVMAVFTLPYLLLASWAGWLADRYAKRHVVIAAKVLELLAMLLGAVGILLAHWGFILAMAFVMGAQSCLFSPALNGSIPELYPDDLVTKANGRLKVVVTIMILGGVVASGWALDIEGAAWGDVPNGRLAVAVGVVAIALLGLAVSFGVPHRPAADPSAAFPVRGPIDTLATLGEVRRDTLLAIVVALNAFTWFTGALLVLLVSALAVQELSLKDSMGSNMVGAELLGIAAGGMAAGFLAKGPRWYRVLPPAAVALAATLLAMAGVPHLGDSWRLPATFVLLGLMGFAGGVLLIPCEAFIQTRPQSAVKGRVIAAANFVAFTGILLSGPANNLLKRVMAPSAAFAAAGGLAWAVAVALAWALRGGKLR